MFNGVPNDQFHQFIASTTSLPVPLSPFPLHGNPSFSAGFDPYRSSSNDEELQQLHHQSQSLNTQIISNNEKQHILDETEKSMDPWSSDEVFLLLKIRSSMQNWYPDFSWEYVSRKLGELGFMRSAEQCKEKFEEESGNVRYNKNYRIFTELDEFYPRGNQEQARVSSERIIKDREIERQNEEDQEKMYMEENSENVAIPCEEMSEEVVKKPLKSNKRKRTEKFEMLKGFCVEIVNKMMARQEELHNKLIDDIVKRDEEIIAREEAWKNEEMVRTKMEIDKWAQELAIANERQAIIIEFLKKFTFEKGQEFENLGKVNNGLNSSALPNALTESALQSGKTPPARNSLSGSNFEPIRKLQEQTDGTEDTTIDTVLQNQENPTKTPSSDPTPSSILATKDSSKANSSSNSLSRPSSDYDDKKGDIGMRWPRDQVLALINLRCKFSNATTSNNDEAANKGPLWERISQGMMELGYKRSAKRCKEKWENINKYYRKTKDSNKKRSVDSRTCPYFHELGRLHGEGTIVAHGNE